MSYGGMFDFVEDITAQDINGARVHLGDLWKECTKCHDWKPLIEGFGQLRCMDSKATPLEYRTQAQCSECRGER